MGRIRLAIVALAAAIASPSVADESTWRWLVSLERRKEVRPVNLPLYAQECGSCHYAYPPGLLPEASWRRLLAPQALPDHFGDNIEMKEAARSALLDYAARNAAEHSLSKRSRQIIASLGDSPAPLRITEITYIRRKHQRIPEEQIRRNPKVQSLAMCDTCHTRASAGDFDDHTVVIPGYGRARW